MLSRENEEIIEPAVVKDAAAIAAIYNYYILTTPVTFEEEKVTANDKDRTFF